jgi:predicted GIY-YIG superfamily endonuclease
VRYNDGRGPLPPAGIHVEPWRGLSLEHRHLQKHRTALYRFFATDGTLLYVGITADLVRRWQTHSTESGWWHLQARHSVEWYPTRHEAEAAERKAIRAEHPVWNVKHTGAAGQYKPHRGLAPREKADPHGMRAEHLIDHRAAAARLAEFAATVDVVHLPFRRAA